ncbi:S49 family peptidase [Arenicellales bacterium nBUS_48]
MSSNYNANNPGTNGEKMQTGNESSEIQQLLTTVLREQGREQKRKRRFRILWLAALVLLLVGGLGGPIWVSDRIPDEFTAVIPISGVIGMERGTSAREVEDAVRAAYGAKGVRGIILAINSPGGSPVQSGQIYRALRRLRLEHPDIPLFAVIADIGASGAYYISVAAEDIFVDPASIVGSIGVISSGFGFVDTMKKLGVERRLTIAGKDKGMLDPFSPVDKNDQKNLQRILNNVHGQFIAAVKEGRGNRLQDHSDIFSGQVWTGEEAIKLGLADSAASINEVARDIIGAPVILDFSIDDDWWTLLLDNFTASVVRSIGLSGTPSLEY